MIAVALTGLTVLLSPFTFLAGLITSATTLPVVGGLVSSLLTTISGLASL